jgi:predicted Holliday junction resolvase-like endonuclease
MNILKFFQESKQILVICPCCGDVFRLSEGTLFTKQRPEPSPFDRMDSAEQKFDRERIRFEEKAAALREEAVALGQKAAQKQLRAIAGPFVARQIDPQDVKVIFHPVEFIAFRGMSDGEVAQIAFIDRPAESKQRAILQESIASAISSGNYAWKLLRVSGEGTVVEE